MCIVYLSEQHTKKSVFKSKYILFINVYILPRRNSLNFSAVLVSNIRMMVPVCEAVATIFPYLFTHIYYTPDLLLYIESLELHLYSLSFSFCSNQ